MKNIADRRSQRSRNYILNAMKKICIILLAALATINVSAQKFAEIHNVQSRMIEPIQQVLVKPLVAEIKILKNELVTFPPSWQLRGVNSLDIYKDERDNGRLIESAVKSAIHEAAQREGADMLVGVTYEVRNHTEKGKVDYENGIDIIISGYPAKYTNWRTFDENQDMKWSEILIDAQRIYDSNDMTRAINSRK